jgi:penicillin amidase
MRTALRWLRYVLTGAALLLLAVALGVAGCLWATLPGGDLQAAIPGLSGPVTVAIDADGIPRITAGSETDAAAALGFLHARERMFQMELMRRAASGTLSEVVGPATLPNDRLMRTLGVKQAAEADLARLAPDTRAVLDAYEAGVNAWIDRRGRFAAAEFLLLGAPAPWKPVDSLLWAKTMGLYLSGNWRMEMARAAMARSLPGVDPLAFWLAGGGSGHPEAMVDPGLAGKAARLAAVLPQFPAPFTLPASASNEWAVDGAHSTTGAPLLAGDPHLGFSLPAVWYLARIDLPGRVLAGATAPGVPFLVIGRNQAIAWTFTSTEADVQDLFVETPAGDGRYMTPNGPAEYRLRQERIRIRGRDPELLTVRETRHGPVISDLAGTDGPVMAISMANLTPGDVAADGLLALNRAGDTAQAGAAAARITSPVQNMLVADRAGIAFFMTGRVPVRRGGDGSVPAPGADGSHDWTGWASGNALPHIVSPASGRLVNANERPAPADFPVWLGRDWYGDWRARRIRALLDGRPKQDVASFAAMQADPVSVFATDTLPRLLAVKTAEGASRTAQALLAGWDGGMTIDRPQPLIFEAWIRAFNRALIARLGVPVGVTPPRPEMVAHALSPAGAVWCGGSCDGLLATVLHRAVAELQASQGPDPAAWRWGVAHPAVFAHPLLRFVPVLGDWTTVKIAAPGSDTTVDRGGTPGPGFEALHGAGYRGVYDLADPDASRFMVTPGQSGHVLSRLSRNFAQRWRDGVGITLAPDAATPDVRVVLVPGASR